MIELPEGLEVTAKQTAASAASGRQPQLRAELPRRPKAGCSPHWPPLNGGPNLGCSGAQAQAKPNPPAKLEAPNLHASAASSRSKSAAGRAALRAGCCGWRKVLLQDSNNNKNIEQMPARANRIDPFMSHERQSASIRPQIASNLNAICALSRADGAQIRAASELRRAASSADALGPEAGETYLIAGATSALVAGSAEASAAECDEKQQSGLWHVNGDGETAVRVTKLRPSPTERARTGSGADCQLARPAGGDGKAKANISSGRLGKRMGRKRPPARLSMRLADSEFRQHQQHRSRHRRADHWARRKDPAQSGAGDGRDINIYVVPQRTQLNLSTESTKRRTLKAPGTNISDQMSNNESNGKLAMRPISKYKPHVKIKTLLRRGWRIFYCALTCGRRSIVCPYYCCRRRRRLLGRLVGRCWPTNGCYAGLNLRRKFRRAAGKEKEKEKKEEEERRRKKRKLFVVKLGGSGAALERLTKPLPRPAERPDPATATTTATTATGLRPPMIDASCDGECSDDGGAGGSGWPSSRTPSKANDWAAPSIAFANCRPKVGATKQRRCQCDDVCLRGATCFVCCNFYCCSASPSHGLGRESDCKCNCACKLDHCQPCRDPQTINQVCRSVSEFKIISPGEQQQANHLARLRASPKRRRGAVSAESWLLATLLLWSLASLQLEQPEPEPEPEAQSGAQRLSFGPPHPSGARLLAASHWPALIIGARQQGGAFKWPFNVQAVSCSATVAPTRRPTSAPTSPASLLPRQRWPAARSPRATGSGAAAVLASSPSPPPRPQPSSAQSNKRRDDAQDEDAADNADEDDLGAEDNGLAEAQVEAASSSASMAANQTPTTANIRRLDGPQRQQQHQTGAVQPAYRWPFIGLVGFIILGASGNILVCMAVWCERRLQTATNYFLLSLAVADLLVCTLVMPFGIIYEFYGRWPFDWRICNLWVTCDVLTCSSSILHMCFISVGRYLGIRNPLHARQANLFVSRRAVLWRIAIAWASSALIASPITMMSLHDRRNIVPNDNECAISNKYFLIFGSLLAFFIPMFVMVPSYVMTVRLLSRRAKFVRNNSLLALSPNQAAASKQVQPVNSNESSGIGNNNNIQQQSHFLPVGGRKTAAAAGATAANAWRPDAGAITREDEEDMNGRTRRRLKSLDELLAAAPYIDEEDLEEAQNRRSVLEVSDKKLQAPKLRQTSRMSSLDGLQTGHSGAAETGRQPQQQHHCPKCQTCGRSRLGARRRFKQQPQQQQQPHSTEEPSSAGSGARSPRPSCACNSLGQGQTQGIGGADERRKWGACCSRRRHCHCCCRRCRPANGSQAAAEAEVAANGSDLKCAQKNSQLTSSTNGARCSDLSSAKELVTCYTAGAGKRQEERRLERLSEGENDQIEPVKEDQTKQPRQQQQQHHQLENGQMLLLSAAEEVQGEQLEEEQDKEQGGIRQQREQQSGAAQDRLERPTSGAPHDKLNKAVVVVVDADADADADACLSAERDNDPRGRQTCAYAGNQISILIVRRDKEQEAKENSAGDIGSNDNDSNSHKTTSSPNDRQDDDGRALGEAQAAPSKQPQAQSAACRSEPEPTGSDHEGHRQHHSHHHRHHRRHQHAQQQQQPEQAGWRKSQQRCHRHHHHACRQVRADGEQVAEQSQRRPHRHHHHHRHHNHHHNLPNHQHRHHHCSRRLCAIEGSASSSGLLLQADGGSSEQPDRGAALEPPNRRPSSASSQANGREPTRRPSASASGPEGQPRLAGSGQVEQRQSGAEKGRKSSSNSSTSGSSSSSSSSNNQLAANRTTKNNRNTQVNFSPGAAQEVPTGAGGGYGEPQMIRYLGSSMQVRSEQKATKVLGVVFFTFVICWTPFFVINFTQAFVERQQLAKWISNEMMTTFLWLGYISSTINPVIYTVFNRNFRRAFRSLILCSKPDYRYSHRSHNSNDLNKSFRLSQYGRGAANNNGGFNSSLYASHRHHSRQQSLVERRKMSGAAGSGVAGSGPKLQQQQQARLLSVNSLQTSVASSGQQQGNATVAVCHQQQQRHQGTGKMLILDDNQSSPLNTNNQPQSQQQSQQAQAQESQALMDNQHQQQSHPVRVNQSSFAHQLMGSQISQQMHLVLRTAYRASLGLLSGAFRGAAHSAPFSQRPKEAEDGEKPEAGIFQSPIAAGAHQAHQSSGSQSNASASAQAHHHDPQQQQVRLKLSFSDQQEQFSKVAPIRKVGK